MIIGITGTLGAGKGTVVEYLKTKGFRHFSARAFFTDELVKRGLPINRDTMTQLGNELREEYGPALFAVKAFEFAAQTGGDVVAESIRSVGEAQYLKAHGARLWAVNADIHIRYERIEKRRSETDAVSFEKFVQDEEREMQNEDPAKQNIAAVMKLADHVFRNDGSVEELFAQVERALGTH